MVSLNVSFCQSRLRDVFLRFSDVSPVFQIFCTRDIDPQDLGFFEISGFSSDVISRQKANSDFDDF